MRLNNEITECTRANFFIVTDNNTIITPDKNILRGITRKKIISLDDMNVREASLSLQDISTAKEIFISSSTKNVLPIVEVDGMQIRDGKPGEITIAVAKKLQKIKEDYLTEN